MTAASTFALFAEFYDAYVGDYAEDIPLYLALAAQCSLPVLEVGCGTGRVLLPLLREGHQVTGVDVADEMLALAQAKIAHAGLGSRCRLQRHNLVDAPLPGPYGLALVTFYTFNYLQTEDEQSAFLRHVAATLAPGAKVALHLFCPVSLVDAAQGGRWVDKGIYSIGAETVALRDRRCLLDGRWEERRQVFTLSSGRQEEIRTVRRWVSQPEAARLLLQAGFVHPVVTG